jgi:hypothetical protein
VTDPTGLLVYVPGIDYTINPATNHIELNRVIGGRIADGTPVLIDYTIAPQPASTIMTDSFSISGRYDIQRGPLHGLGVYGRFNMQDQNIDSPNPSAIVDNSFKDYIAGADYRFWDFILAGEGELYDSAVLPYNAVRASLTWQHRFGDEWRLAARTAFTRLNYTLRDEQNDLMTVSGLAEYRLNQQLTASLTALWRKQNDTIYGDSDGFEQQLSLNWRHRQTTVTALLRNSMFQAPAQDNSFQFFQVIIKREF